MGTPNLWVTIDAKRNAKAEEMSTVAASQKLDPRRRIERNKDKKSQVHRDVPQRHNGDI